MGEVVRQEWVEDIERPGTLVPVGDIPALRRGDSITITTQLVDGVVMPWAESEVRFGQPSTRQEEI